MLRLETNVQSFTVDQETILLDTGTGRYYGLNPTASIMLACALGTPDEEGALGSLVLEYEAPHERLKADLHALIADLKGKHLAVHSAELPHDDTGQKGS